ncbi:hypothetical protein D7V97_20650 [Corallococcus sp. CA053C]|uniref:ELWxxDGT repeat protein n=1 Tax=Corallococcus sp. CA053C TaxID=2316732 RepID=UPI000EA409B3|nr:ELWxxDGT repeat protein [Corallococcus sp. CA053C]RKH08019.1 hypothetical protein D7V97_20650 [Corallococcus sp. CA053C]
MAAWRGVPGIVLLLLAGGVGCGPEEERGEERGEVAAQAQEAPMPCGRWASPVGDLRKGTEGSKPEALVPVKGQVFYAADDGISGRELWVTDGDTAKARRVKDVRTGPSGSTPRFLTAVGRQLFFVADDGHHGPELWRTEGSAKDTVLVADLRPGSVGSAPDGLTAVGGRLYFTADDGVHGRELWVSDGTAKGTRLVQEFVPGPGSLFLDELTAWNGRLALVAYDDDSVTLWAVDGPSGRAQVFFRGPAWTVLLALTPVGVDRLFFLADVGVGEADLWVSRGQPSSTVRLRHFAGDYPSELTPLGDAVFFMAGAEGFFGEPGDRWFGGELWRSDGTTPGTRRVKDVRLGAEGSLPSGLTVMDGQLYFAADDGVHGRELWRTDGSSQGTQLVQDLEPGPGSSAPTALKAMDGWLFLSAMTGTRGREAWYSDGSSDRVQQLHDLAPGGQSSNPRGFVHAGAHVFFVATEPTRGEEPWALPFLPVVDCSVAVK